MNKELLVINNTSSTNNTVITNFSNVKYTYLIWAFLVLLFCFATFLFLNKSHDYTEGYINIQKDIFLYLNSKLSSLPNLQYNLTQLGDVIILFPFVSVFILYAPKLWEAILTSSILSLITSALLKKIFSVPRPAAILENESFVIIGKTLKGHTSLPSGHSMTTFIVISLLLFAFMPKKGWYKIVWCLSIILLGFTITFSRVAVGAHYPLDVIIGSTIGFILAIIGIKLSKYLNWASKIKIKNQSIVLIFILLCWMGLVLQKIIDKNLLIAYFSLIPLVVVLYLIVKKNVQSKN